MNAPVTHSRVIATLVTLALSLPATATAGLRIAVSSNFTETLRTLADTFEERSRESITIIPGSTGKLYAQIRNGAPFDVFLAADAERPTALEKDGHCVAGSRMTYAVGRLALWTSHMDMNDVAALLTAKPQPRIAIANPELAPYGRAAHETLTSLQLWDSYSSRLVRGENVGQTMQFVHSGNATAGFVAYSQILRLPANQEGSHWMVPDDLYTPVAQQAVLVRETPAGRQFLAFLGSPGALQIVRAAGYDTP